jgi:hypothetical protein
VQAQAQTNLQNFLTRLAKRVELLEAELPTTQREIFEEALNHPSSSLLLQKALVSAAATESDDRHIILSELIAQRLTAGADDMVALVGAAACDVVNALSSRQIKLLGLVVRLFSIRPDTPPKLESQEEYDNYVTSWWSELDRLSQGLEGTTHLDLEHLVGLSCISVSFAAKNLLQLLTLATDGRQFKLDLSTFERFPWWSRFQRVWSVDVMHVTLTSVGTLIGVLYHDSHLGSKTTINW